jgi:hypothetical protein
MERPWSYLCVDHEVIWLEADEKALERERHMVQ